MSVTDFVKRARCVVDSEADDSVGGLGRGTGPSFQGPDGRPEGGGGELRTNEFAPGKMELKSMADEKRLENSWIEQNQKCSIFLIAFEDRGLVDCPSSNQPSFS